MSTLIHIGYPKTATSWFKNYFYPHIKNTNTIYADNIVYDLEGDNKEIEIIKNNSISNKEHTIIVSHKFSGLVDFRWEDGKYRKYFAPQLKKSFPDANIIVFLRGQTDFLASSYSSYLTHGGTYTFRKLYKIGQLTNGQMFALEYLDYNKLIDQYIELFGADNVHIFLYEDFLADKQGFLQQYKKQFNFEINTSNISLKKYNTKLRKGFAAFLRFSNMFSKKGVKPKKYIFNVPFLFAWLNSKSAIKINKYKIWGGFLDNFKILGADLISEINEYYKVSNNKLLKYKACQSIKKYEYPL